MEQGALLIFPDFHRYKNMSDKRTRFIRFDTRLHSFSYKMFAPHNVSQPHKSQRLLKGK